MPFGCKTGLRRIHLISLRDLPFLVKKSISPIANAMPFCLFFVMIGAAVTKLSPHNNDQTKSYSFNKLMLIALGTTHVFILFHEVIRTFEKLLQPINILRKCLLASMCFFTRILTPLAFAVINYMGAGEINWGTKKAESYLFVIFFYYASATSIFEAIYSACFKNEYSKALLDTCNGVCLILMATGLLVGDICDVSKVILLAPIGAFIYLVSSSLGYAKKALNEKNNHTVIEQNTNLDQTTVLFHPLPHMTYPQVTQTMVTLTNPPAPLYTRQLVLPSRPIFQPQQFSVFPIEAERAQFSAMPYL